MINFYIELNTSLFLNSTSYHHNYYTVNDTYTIRTITNIPKN